MHRRHTSLLKTYKEQKFKLDTMKNTEHLNCKPGPQELSNLSGRAKAFKHWKVIKLNFTEVKTLKKDMSWYFMKRYQIKKLASATTIQERKSPWN